MNINGVITKEEMDNFIASYSKTYKTTKKLSLLGKIFWLFYAGLICVLLFVSWHIKYGVGLLVCIFGTPIAINEFRLNFKNSRLMKALSLFKNTDEFLSSPDEYCFSVDDEKVTVNDKITVKYTDVVVNAQHGQYTILVGKDNMPVVIKTDFDQQWRIFEILNKHNKSGFITAPSKNGMAVNEKIMEYAKTTGNKKRLKKKRKVIKFSAVLTIPALLCMLYIGSINDNSAHDKNEYKYDRNILDSPFAQMAEEYTETKSYKAIHDIYFDWRAQTQKTVVKLHTVEDVLISLEIFYRDKDGTPYNISYTDSPEKQIRLVDSPPVSDWEEQIRNLSNFNLLKNSYPYVFKFYDLSFFGSAELTLKDKNIFTVYDNMHIGFYRKCYSCINDKADNSYIIYFSEKDVEQPEKLAEYFENLADKYNKAQYDELVVDREELLDALIKYCNLP